MVNRTTYNVLFTEVKNFLEKLLPLYRKMFGHYSNPY